MFKDDVSLSQVKDEVIFRKKGEALRIRLREKSLCCNGFWIAENIPQEEQRSSLLGKDEVASSNLASSSTKSPETAMVLGLLLFIEKPLQ